MTAIGIDLGTTNSCVALWRGGRADVIKDSEGQNITPSVVGVRESGEIIAGWPAKREQELNPEHTYRAIKRLIGRQDVDPQVGLTQEVSAFGIAPAEGNGEAWIVGREHLHPPAQISAHVLRRVKAAAELALGKPISKAVITVPAYFNDAQRKATRDAGEIAGFDVLRILNEPTAAALALDLGKDGAKTVAVYDLGGGTFDLSILKTDGDDHEVVTSNGDTFLGGEDFDRLIVDHLANAFMAAHDIDLRADKVTRARLKEAAETAKCALSFAETTHVALTHMALDKETKAPLTLEADIDRSVLEAASADLIQRTLDLCAMALGDAGLTTADIDQVVLVGGQTRMPAVQAAVRGFFGGVPVMAPDPDQIVAQGAAVMAAALTGQLAIELEDVTPFALGVETATHGMHVLLPAQSKIPHHVTRPFTTAEPDQDAVTVRLRQGNSDDARDNLPLGQFHLEGVRPAKSGRTVVDVTIDIDADGIMTASARDRGSGRTQNLTVETMGLSPRAIERMAKQAAKAAA